MIDWLRDYNETHDEKVRFFGVEYFATRPFVYDSIESYTSRNAPQFLDQAREHVAAIRPSAEYMGEYLRWFMAEAEDEQSYVQHAEELHDLIDGIAASGPEQAEAEHAARLDTLLLHRLHDPGRQRSVPRHAGRRET